jgi:23S rRNA (uracil1939-C5)-methyltransferase
MAAPGDLVTVTVERPAAGGAMIARVDGRILLVTGAIPGERVRARIDRASRSVLFASTAGVEDASPDRRPPFDDPACGGCLYSHIAYPRQLAIKREVIADAFARIAHVPALPAFAVAASAEHGYRMRARLHMRGRRIGFFREGTHQLCDARATRQLLPATCDALDRVAAAAASLGDAVREVELSENVEASQRVVHVETAQPIGARVLAQLTTIEGLTPPPFVTDTLSIGGKAIALRRHVQAFFQGNRFLLGGLVEHVAALVPEGSSVLDLYAGAGLFSLAAAEARGAAVTAVEGDRFAADDLRANASTAAGVAPVRSDVESFVREYRRSGRGAPAVVIVDPPRTGLSPDAAAGIVDLRSPRLVYVSCDVATLARDARRVIDAGYSIARVDAFDLFPNTPHVETVVAFVRV